MDTANYLSRFWRGAKTWRSFSLGPVTLHFRLGRMYRRRLEPPPWWQTPGSVAATAGESPARAGEVALIAGMGAEIGPALVRKLTEVGMRTAVVSRTAFMQGGEQLPRSYSCDVTNERETARVVNDVIRDVGVPSLLVYGVQGWSPGRFVDIEVADFEEAWRANCLGAFILAQQVTRAMLSVGRGTIVFLGSTSGTVGRAGYLNLATGKFGLRAMAQVMARELGPRGIHVVHLIIDAHVQAVSQEAGPHSNPDELADLIQSLHAQPRSVWTHELDVRPHNEAFWQHC